MSSVRMGDHEAWTTVDVAPNIVRVHATHNVDIDAELEQAVVGIKSALEHEPIPPS